MQFRTLVLLALAVVLLSGCEAISAIFGAGLWVGLLAAVVVIAAVAFVIGKMRKP